MPENSKSATALFRAEVSTGGGTRRFGSVFVHQPWGYRIAAALACVFIILVVSFAYFGTYTRKATVTGLLMPEQGILRLTATGTGLLAQVMVSEGQYVEAGQVLFIVSGERISTAGATQHLIAEQLSQRLSLLERNRWLASERIAGQIRMLDSRMATIDLELQQLDEEGRLLQRRVSLSEAHLQRQQ